MHRKLVEKIAEAALPTEFGLFKIVGFKSKIEEKNYVALVKGNIKGKENVLVRVHSGCLTGDVFHSLRCDCNKQLKKSMELIEKEGAGVLLYIESHEGRGIGLMSKLKAYSLQDTGLDTVEANKELGLPIDARNFEPGAQILQMLGLTTLRLLTNNPNKIDCLEKYGLKVVERIPLNIPMNEFNEAYLQTKKEKLGHLL